MSATSTPPFPDDPRKESLIEYPCDFPIKVMGARVDGFAEAMVEIAKKIRPELQPCHSRNTTQQSRELPQFHSDHTRH